MPCINAYFSIKLWKKIFFTTLLELTISRNCVWLETEIDWFFKMTLHSLLWHNIWKHWEDSFYRLAKVNSKVLKQFAKTTQIITGSTNYVVPFALYDLLLFGSLAALCFIGEDIGLPKADTTKGVKIILTNLNIMIFLIMVFACGTMYGFVETFLFVYLKVK